MDNFPPLQQPMRFGNKAFRSWLDKVITDIISLHESILPKELYPAIIELGPYLCESFGNYTRIDYGTGHETTFMLWLCT